MAGQGRIPRTETRRPAAAAVRKISDGKPRLDRAAPRRPVPAQSEPPVAARARGGGETAAGFGDPADDRGACRRSCEEAGASGRQKTDARSTRTGDKRTDAARPESAQNHARLDRPKRRLARGRCLRRPKSRALRRDAAPGRGRSASTAARDLALTRLCNGGVAGQGRGAGKIQHRPGSGATCAGCEQGHRSLRTPRARRSRRAGPPVGRQDAGASGPDLE